MLQMNGMRINKYLCECGLCSRREADRLVAEGRVRIDGEIAQPAAQADENSVVTVDGQKVRLVSEKTYLKFYKPRGVVCTLDAREKNNLRDYLHLGGRVTYAGRLDQNSEGLLILTDDGDLIQQMMAARNAHEKEYEVTVSREIGDGFLSRMEEGIYLTDLEVTTRPCRVRQTGRKTFRIILTQGLNRQIRRMCKACGYGVVSLKRVRVVNITLGDLKPGECVPLTADELETLKRTVMGQG